MTGLPCLEEKLARDKFVDDGYDPQEIYAGGAKDSDGHSTNIRAHIPDPWMGMISELVASPEWPEYRKPTDVYRDAIYHRIRWAGRQTNRKTSDRVRTLMAQAQAEAALRYRMNMQHSHRAIMTLMQETFSMAIANSDYTGLRETIKDLEAQLSKMDEPWRSELGRELASWERRL